MRRGTQPHGAAETQTTEPLRKYSDMLGCGASGVHIDTEKPSEATPHCFVVALRELRDELWLHGTQGIVRPCRSAI